jgi:formylglycine-generating enzyme required for sulfatase activity
MSFDVFISYAHQDKATADAACAKLETDGIRCWIAPRDVPPGAEWAGAIIDAIDHCRAMVLIFSSSTNGSKQIHREVQRAFDREVPVVPFRIENVTPEKSLAYYMGPVHWLDALTSPLEQHLKKLAVSVKPFAQLNAFGDKKSEAPEPRGPEGLRRTENDPLRRPEPRKLWHPSRRPLLIAGALGIILVGSIGVWLDTSWRPVSRQPPLVRPSPTPTPVPPQSQSVQPSAAPVQLSNIGPLSPERERALRAKDSFKECDNCPEMMVMPAGSFIMGSPDTEQGRYSNESPQRKVTIATQFAAGRFAVTFDEWDACVADGGCDGYRPADQGWGRGRRPVVNVSWDDTKTYLAWLSRKTGKSYGLLSEAEFEYAARADTTTAYYWGAEIGVGNANCKGCGGQWNHGPTAPVGSFAANAFGIYDMAGNVWEWVEDCRHDNYNGAPTDGSAWTAGNCTRVFRGGSWMYEPRFLRSAYRGGDSSGYRYSDLGFRVGRTVGP